MSDLACIVFKPTSVLTTDGQTIRGTGFFSDRLPTSTADRIQLDLRIPTLDDGEPAIFGEARMSGGYSSPVRLARMPEGLRLLYVIECEFVMASVS